MSKKTTMVWSYDNFAFKSAFPVESKKNNCTWLNEIQTKSDQVLQLAVAH